MRPFDVLRTFDTRIILGNVLRVRARLLILAFGAEVVVLSIIVELVVVTEFVN